MKRVTLAACVALLALFAGCGPTVGDACTTNRECGGQICINTDYVPGGYCSRQCSLGDATSCPGGSLCIKDGQARDNPACFRICRTAQECRHGYSCRSVKDSAQPVCIGPSGF